MNTKIPRNIIKRSSRSRIRNINIEIILIARRHVLRHVPKVPSFIRHIGKQGRTIRCKITDLTIRPITDPRERRIRPQFNTYYVAAIRSPGYVVGAACLDDVAGLGEGNWVVEAGGIVGVNVTGCLQRKQKEEG